MVSKGELTRGRILDVAHGLILDHGYSGVSIDQIIDQIDVTKGAFFHHFKNKGELAHSLIRRYASDSVALFRAKLSRAKKLSDDPLQQFVIFIRLYEELFEGLTEVYPGCLIASYVYELQQFDDDIKLIVNEEFLLSRKDLSALIEDIKEIHPPMVPVDSTVLADAFMATFEGSFVLSKSLAEPDIIVEQLRLYRTFISVLFASKKL